MSSLERLSWSRPTGVALGEQVPLDLEAESIQDIPFVGRHGEFEQPPIDRTERALCLRSVP